MQAHTLQRHTVTSGVGLQLSERTMYMLLLYLSKALYGPCLTGWSLIYRGPPLGATHICPGLQQPPFSSVSTIMWTQNTAVGARALSTDIHQRLGPPPLPLQMPQLHPPTLATLKLDLWSHLTWALLAFSKSHSPPLPLPPLPLRLNPN